MPRPRRDNPRPRSRPVKPIDWALVDELLLAGCNGAEIAPHFDMHPTTFYDRVLLEKGMIFTDYSTEKRFKGDSLLRHVQYKKAVKGDNTLLIWLGKNRLNQRESSEVNVSPETAKTFISVMEQLQRAREDKNSTLVR